MKMRKLLALLPVCALVAFALAPSSASAWTHCGTPQAEADCPPITTCINGVETQVPDNGQYQPGECLPPPPKTITVCLNGEQVTVPENEIPAGATEGECQPVVPPPNPPEAPVPPTPPVDVPPTTPEDTPPTVDIGTPENEVGGKEQAKNHNGGGQVAGQPQNSEVAGAEQTLPFTGTSPGFLLGLVGLGAIALMGGRKLRKLAA